MIRDEGALRKQIVELVAFSSPWARKVAWHGPQSGLAERLGVTESVIDDAVALVRAGFAPRIDGKKIHTNFDIQVPDILYVELRRLAQLACKMKAGPFLRSLLHAAMLTMREPSARPARSWGKMDGPPPRKRVDDAFPRTHVCLGLSRGLAEALERRAAAYGVAKSQYVLLWIADLCEYRLRDLRVQPIEKGQMFDDPRSYVLPQIEQTWETQAVEVSEASRATVVRRKKKIAET